MPANRFTNIAAIHADMNAMRHSEPGYIYATQLDAIASRLHVRELIAHDTGHATSLALGGKLANIRADVIQVRDVMLRNPLGLDEPSRQRIDLLIATILRSLIGASRLTGEAIARKRIAEAAEASSTRHIRDSRDPNRGTVCGAAWTDPPVGTGPKCMDCLSVCGRRAVQGLRPALKAIGVDASYGGVVQSIDELER